MTPTHQKIEHDAGAPPARAATPNSEIVGYVNRRTGQLVCLNHGERDVDSLLSPWAALRLVACERSSAPVICHECGAWINDESTRYAAVTTHRGDWRRRFVSRRGR